MNKLFYKLDDNRIWSVSEAKFVDSAPEDSTIWDIEAFGDKSSLDFLIEELEIRNFPKGELKSDEEFASEARTKRNQLLSETDYLVTPDYPLTEAQKQTLYSYRQALRDIPTQKGFPREITWPTLNLK